MIAEAPRSEDLDRAVACVRAHPRATPLAAFAYEVLSAQAEGRSLYSGPQFMVQRAEGHDVDRDGAATDLGNLLTILERGPAERAEFALVASFAARGLDDALAAEGEDDRRRRARKWVGHMEWLELATPYRVTPCVERLVSVERRATLNEAWAEAAKRDEVADGDVDLGRSARQAARLAACKALQADAHPVEILRVQGHAAPITRRPVLAVLRWLSGVALLQWALRVLGFLARVEREVEVELSGNTLRVRRRTSWLGRTLRDVEAVYALERVSGAFRRARYALLRTLTGMFALAVGILLGGHLAFDASSGGAPLLFVLAAVVIAAGSGLDLALDVLGPAARGRVHLQIDLHDARSVKLGDVPIGQADALLVRLRELIDTRPR